MKESKEIKVNVMNAIITLTALKKEMLEHQCFMYSIKLMTCIILSHTLRAEIYEAMHQYVFVHKFL